MGGGGRHLVAPPPDHKHSFRYDWLTTETSPLRPSALMLTLCDSENSGHCRNLLVVVVSPPWPPQCRRCCQPFWLHKLLFQQFGLFCFEL